MLLYCNHCDINHIDFFPLLRSFSGGVGGRSDALVVEESLSTFPLAIMNCASRSYPKPQKPSIVQTRKLIESDRNPKNSVSRSCFKLSFVASLFSFVEIWSNRTTQLRHSPLCHLGLSFSWNLEVWFCFCFDRFVLFGSQKEKCFLVNVHTGVLKKYAD